MAYRNDPDGTRLPIKLDTTSNGEFMPVPLTEVNRIANDVAMDQATGNAKRSGLSRRRFLVSSCGAASTLLAFNEVNAAAGKTGSYFAINAAAAVDPEIAQAALDGREFIFDVQGHFVDPNGRWIREHPERAQGFSFAPKFNCAIGDAEDSAPQIACLGPDEFVKDVFLDSDTDMMVLSFVPSSREDEPLTIN